MPLQIDIVPVESGDTRLDIKGSFIIDHATQNHRAILLAPWPLSAQLAEALER